MVSSTHSAALGGTKASGLMRCWLFSAPPLYVLFGLVVGVSLSGVPYKPSNLKVSPYCGS